MMDLGTRLIKWPHQALAVLTRKKQLAALSESVLDSKTKREKSTITAYRIPEVVPVVSYCYG
jgi:hypothetical protein